MNQMLDQLEKSVRETIKCRLEEIRREEMDEAVKTAQKNIERRVREFTAQLGINVAKTVHMDRFSEELIIRVDYKNLNVIGGPNGV